MSNTQYPEIAYMNGHKGIHVNDGVYKLEKPFRVNIDEWGNNEAYADYSVIGANYSNDYTECEIVYFTNCSRTALNNLKIDLMRSDNIQLGYIDNLNQTKDTILLGGLTYAI